MATPLRLLTRGTWPEAKRFAEILRKETVGGVLLLVAAAMAVGWANSPWSAAYRTISEFTVGPERLHLRLSISAWAADGLLAIFFFVVGLELKREFVAGDLRDPRRAALPILAAVGGMVVPAVIFVTVNLIAGHRENLVGWAVPTATDIAFALAVLAVLSTHLPSALRTFLLDPGGRRRPAGHHHHRHLLHRRPLAGAAGACADPAWAIRGGRPARCPTVVVVGAAGRGRVGPRARQRGACDGRRSAAGLRRPGAWAGRPSGPPSGSSTGCDRSPRASRCRCSPSSPRG